MQEQGRTKRPAKERIVKVSIEPEIAPRFNIGTRWEVVAASLDSLWQGAHTITLQEIEAEGDEGS